MFGRLTRTIDHVRAPGGGRIGLTACPGLRLRPATDGESTERRLTRDLDALAHWRAEALVTLLGRGEMELLGVADLAERLQARAIAWFHLPIIDGSPPGSAFETDWPAAAATLHAILDRDGRVAVHCRAGLGRSGCVAARLLIERGMDNREAVRAVRAARPFAIETGEQWTWVQRLTSGRP